MAHRTDQPDPGPTPGHTARDCALCAILRHPAQAKQGRALTRHLAHSPFPVQQVGAR
ncbi:hypothetical protein [Streptomyces sp. DSM 40484]|uniref:hypothetical protein n=1 Tax=Streptomyces kroppenstedtii TaxID=3051181 RepID=UPI0028D7E491|nr:hypothetical protein [Streptomyces sp. DSM 40484]